MNILNKDESQGLVKNFKKEFKKEEKYKWKHPGEPGEFMWINKRDLNIDGTYQRDQVSEGKVIQIAKEWDWKLFGVLAVVQREDRSFWVYDGGHRCRGAFKRRDIQLLPCMVFQVADASAEAMAFVGTNTMKSAVSAFHLHRAMLKAQQPVAVAVERIVNKYGYKVAQEDRKFAFRAVRTLQKMVERDEVLAERVFAACAEIAMDGEAFNSKVLEALFECQYKLSDRADVLSGPHLEKLKARTMPGLEREVTRQKALLGKGGPAVGARAILEVINKGKSRKLTFEFSAQ
jgi:hypothetical protein